MLKVTFYCLTGGQESLYAMENNDYHSRLCDCFGDCSSCLLGMFSPCLLNASNISQLRGEDCRATHCLCCHCPFWTRQLLRKKNQMPRDVIHDCIVFTFCSPCAICQDSREIRIYRTQQSGYMDSLIIHENP